MARRIRLARSSARAFPRDQAHALRLRVARASARAAPALTRKPAPTTRRSPRIIVVTSGKGGVGKTNLTVNLAVTFAQAGRQVMVFDGDLGTANVDVLLGMPPRPGLAAVLTGNRRLEEVISPGPYGIRVITGVSGLVDGADYAPARRQAALRMLGDLGEAADFILLDTGAGISSAVLEVLAAAPEALVVVTPEPTAITDAYALIKAATQHAPKTSLRLVVNQATDEKEGRETARNLQAVVHRFLGVRFPWWCTLPYDPHVPQAVRQQVPVVACYPDSPTAGAITALAHRLDGTRPTPAVTKTPASSGWAAMLSRLLRRPREGHRAAPVTAGVSV